MDSKLTFNEHVKQVCSKSNRMLGLIKRNCWNIKNPKTLIKLYCSLVRPYIEFNSVIYNCMSNTLLAKINIIQKRFIKFVSRSCNIPLSTIHFPTLSSRLSYLDSLFFYKCVNGYFGCDLVSPFGLSVKPRRFRNSFNSLFNIQFSRVNVTKNGFIVRLPKLYNCLVDQDASIDIYFDSFRTFKRKIKLCI